MLSRRRQPVDARAEHHDDLVELGASAWTRLAALHHPGVPRLEVTDHAPVDRRFLARIPLQALPADGFPRLPVR
ncbi:MAG: hypothetical protein U5Q44_02005 [Dehalococcoidia bacterium]|nr:hypothetical protein [Dehalococcoidia bacterium]